MRAALTTDPASEANEHSDVKRTSFFDLPPELRNRIYHFLFKGQEIAIRHIDTTTTWKDSGDLVVKKWISRERDAGANILFVSKATLAEAKPILLGLATFSLKSNHLFPGSNVYPQVQQGFGYTEIQSTHSVIVSEPRLPYKLLRWMPSLHAVIIHDSSNTVSRETLGQFKLLCGWDSQTLLGTFSRYWSRQGYNSVLKHIEGRAEHQNLQAQFLLGSRTKFHGRTAKMWVWVDVVKEMIWVTDTEDQNEILILARVVPGLSATLSRLSGRM